MKNLIVALLVSFIATEAGFAETGVQSRASARPHPSPALLRRIKSEYEVYGIVHFSINTFTDREWGYGNEDPAWFNPSGFDAEKIVEDCKNGSLQGLVVVAKHHDGFCLWPTRTTSHNISKSPFRGGKGDYLREMERACRKYGLKLGVYVSPWDRNNAMYATPAYREIFWKQVLEIFSGDYGDLNELWFDGANGGDGYYGGKCERRKIPKNYYDFAGLIKEVGKYQKDFCTFYDWDEGELHYPGNESGDLSPDARITYPLRSDKPTPGWENCLYTGDVNGSIVKQVECDFPLRVGWFYHPEHDGYSKSPYYLMKIYLRTVGNGGTMNVGISPDRRGLLTYEDAMSLKTFAEIKKRFFSKKVASAAEPFNMVVMREDVSQGEHVDGWKLSLDGKEISSGRSIGVKRIRTFDQMLCGGELSLAVTAGSAKAEDIGIELYNVDPSLMRAVSASQAPQRPQASFESVGMPTKTTDSGIVYQFKYCHKFHSVIIAPDIKRLGGTPTAFRLSYSMDGVSWTDDDTVYRLGNVAANPIAQNVKLSKPVHARYVKLQSLAALKDGERIAVGSFQLVTK
jgi:alpha-L-fucosidase